MLINTAVFGPLEVEAERVFHLPDGLFGFDGIHSYALITKQEDDFNLMWFQAVDDTVPCFVVFDPFQVVDGYAPQLEKFDLVALGCEDADELTFLVIAVVPEDITKTTVNLKSPIVLNPKGNRARQVILSNKDYPIKFPLMDDEPEVAGVAKLAPGSAG